GSWLALWLKRLGATVGGAGLAAPTVPNAHELFQSFAFDEQTECDLRNVEAFAAVVRKFSPDLVFHLAAQPLVRASYAEPLETLQINTLGTANVLEAIRRVESPAAIIVVTTDKCYENRGWEFGYREV